MDEIDLITIKQRTIRGVAALASGTFLLQIITIFSQFIISILLSPSVFGIFAILSAVVAILTYFSDIGLAAALIQKKEKLTEEDLKTTFTIQQGLIVLLVIIGLFLSKPIADFYHVDTNGLWLLRAIVFAFFLSSLKTIPTILLERSIKFSQITVVSLAEAIIFYAAIIGMAVTNHTIESFTVAVLARGTGGLILMYMLSPWTPRLGINSIAARKLLSFGLPMQANSIIALFKDHVFLLYLGKALTHSQVGYYGWAKSWSEAPLRLIMDSMSKVMFPVYARLQHDKKALSNMLEKSLFFQASCIFPMSIGAAFLIAPLVSLIPRYGKWEPALPLFYFFVATSIFASIAVPLTHVLNATGNVKKTLTLMTFWTTLIWTLTPISISFFGFIGAAISASVVGASSLITIFFVKQIVPFSLKKSFLSPIVSSIILGVGLYFVSQYIPTTWIGVGMLVGCGLLLYGVAFLALEFRSIRSDIQFVKQLLKKRIQT